MEKQYRLKKNDDDDADAPYSPWCTYRAQDDSADNRAGRAKRAKQDTPESGNE